MHDAEAQVCTEGMLSGGGSTCASGAWPPGRLPAALSCVLDMLRLTCIHQAPVHGCDCHGLSLKRQLCEFSEGVCRNVRIHTTQCCLVSPQSLLHLSSVDAGPGGRGGDLESNKKIGLVLALFFCRSSP